MPRAVIASAANRIARRTGTASRRRRPGPPGPFLRLEGFKIPPNRGATIGFGLRLPAAGEVRLDDARLTYRENGDDHELRAGHTARICIVVTKDAC